MSSGSNTFWRKSKTFKKRKIKLGALKGHISKVLRLLNKTKTLIVLCSFSVTFGHLPSLSWSFSHITSHYSHCLSGVEVRGCMYPPGSLFKGSSFAQKHEEQRVIVIPMQKNVVSVLMDFIMTSKSCICLIVDSVCKVLLK